MKLGLLVNHQTTLNLVFSTQWKSCVWAIASYQNVVAELGKRYDESRMALVKTLGVEVKDKPGDFAIPECNRVDFTNGMNELLDVEIELPVLKLKLENCKDQDQFTSTHILALVELGIMEFPKE